MFSLSRKEENQKKKGPFVETTQIVALMDANIPPSGILLLFLTKNDSSTFIFN